jgi:hypothetical protein
MERNADDMFGATGNVGSSTGGTSSMGAGMADNTQPAGGLDYSAGTAAPPTPSTQNTTADLKATAQDKLGQLRDKTKNLQSSLADRLEQGAEKIRQRNQSSTLAGATADGSSSVAVATDDRTKMQDSVARGMEKSADWLRNGDLKGDIERQVRENPGRTLLVALGVGYLLGKAFRGGNR